MQSLSGVPEDVEPMDSDPEATDNAGVNDEMSATNGDQEATQQTTEEDNVDVHY